MLGMLLDAGEQSSRAFVRESGSLVLGGLRERRAITARAGIRRLLADSCCQAVLILLMLLMIRVLSTELRAGLSQQPLVQQVILGAILACALIGFERIAAISGLAAFAAFGPLGPHTQLVLLATGLVPFACLLVMVRAPRQRPRDPRRLLWLAPVIVLAALGHPRLGRPAGGPRGHVRRRPAPTLSRPTVGDRLRPGLDRRAGPRNPTGPGRSGLACDPGRRGRRAHAHRRRWATVDHAPQRYRVANPKTATSSRERG